ncbi:MAG: DUF1638 domain-containing protein [Oscillospiraceae bacterium]|jgi:hypothetical protein|nr:DUF1638 domain-containing protein [Oscillospiraceae bacterium]
MKMISCKIFYREVSLLTARSPHYFDVTYLRQGLHAHPDRLRGVLQAEIDAVDSMTDIHTNYPPDGGSFDAILLGYALCSNCVEGLSSARHTLVLPKAHDCVSLFLGSRERYSDYFFNHKGTFWSNASWAENCFLPDGRRAAAALAGFTKRYGAERAAKLLSASERWKDNYSGTTFIRWGEFSGTDIQAEAERRCRACAEYNGWAFDTLEGDSAWMRRFLDGDWDDERFLVVPPGRRIILTYDERLVDYGR